MDKINKMTENFTNNDPKDQLSPEVRKILEEESKQAEVKAAIDAAAEEGIDITPEEAKQILSNDNTPK